MFREITRRWLSIFFLQTAGNYLVAKEKFFFGYYGIVHFGIGCYGIE